MQTSVLSSPLTPFVKFVFPVVWSFGFGAGVLSRWLNFARGQGGFLPQSDEEWEFSIAWIIGTALLWWLCGRLKYVRLDGAILHVSNYVREIVVPVTAIDRISENRWININPVTVHFDKATPFGSSIVFMPKGFTFLSWWSHPVVEELEKRIGSAHANAEYELRRSSRKRQ